MILEGRKTGDENAGCGDEDLTGGKQDSSREHERVLDTDVVSKHVPVDQQNCSSQIGVT